MLGFGSYRRVFMAHRIREGMAPLNNPHLGNPSLIFESRKFECFDERIGK
jgi:hypothetical protein